MLDGVVEEHRHAFVHLGEELESLVFGLAG